MKMTPVSARPRNDPAPRVTLARAADSASARDLFLDTVRAVAVIRVVIWHAYGWAPITWVISAVPAMIFVSGHLFAKSASRRPAGAVVHDRLRRLLVPYWAFAIGAWLIMIGARVISRTPETALPWRSLPAWILPLNDPRGSVWEGGWLAQPLWYLRVLLLVLLTAPLLWRAARRFPQLTVAVLLAATMVIELAEIRTNWHPTWAPDLLWKVGDYTLYATFFAFGVAHFHGRPMSGGRSARLAAFAAVCGITWAIVSPPQDGIVNNSHVLHFFIGTSWLALAFAVRPAIIAFAERRLVNGVIRGIGRRSLTIYLWHSAAAITTWHLLVEFSPLPRGAHSLGIAVGTTFITIAAVTLFGRLEDRAARRVATAPAPFEAAPVGRLSPPRVRDTGPLFQPLRWMSAVTGLVVLGVCAAYALPPAWDEGRNSRPAGDAFAGSVAQPADAASASQPRPNAPRVPSQSPRRPVFNPANPAAGPTTTVSRAPITLPRAGPSVDEAPGAAVREAWTPESSRVDDELASALNAAVDRWTTTWGVEGIRIAVARPDVFAWQAAFGIDWDGNDLTTIAPFDIESITKTFTAALVWQMAEGGELNVDATVDSLSGVPDWPAETYTIRQLLEHRTGLPDYHNTTAYAPDDQPPIERAVTSSLFAPWVGGQYYSSTNYLILGRFLEDRTGQSLDTLVRTRLLQPAGIEGRFTRATSTFEAPGGGAAGLTSNLYGLLVWGETMMRRHSLINDDSWAQLTAFDERSSLGAGVYGYCPCSFDNEGQPTWQRIGHSGGTTSLQYDGGQDLLFSLQVPAGVWGSNTIPLEMLLENLTNIVANHEFK
jgi:CubicO group peptidase (beta-lactamase class C family)/peptidoglycan/LPS O-acetylase OafA/YrhL